MKLPFERPRVLTAMIAGAAVTQIARGSKSLSPAAREIVAAIASLAPAAVALRSSELAAYHGAEHIAIGTYEHGEARDKEHERCGSHLVGPLLGSLMIGNVLASRAPRQFRLRRAGPRVAGRGRGLDGDLLVDGAEPGASALEGARQARARAPAPPRDGRADAGAARGRRGGARRVPRAREWSTETKRERLDPEVFDLPVEKMRAGYYTDAYFNHARAALLEDGRHPRVVMQVFQKNRSYLGGMDEAIAILKLCSHDWEQLTVHALYDGDRIEPFEPVLHIEGDYTLFAHLETAYLGSARAQDADHDERRPRARGRAGQADHLHARAPRPSPRPDRRRLRGATSRARSSARRSA